MGVGKRWAWAVALTLLIGGLAAPAAASADCAVPGDPDATMDTSREFDGSFAGSLQGANVQIPFDVPAATTAIRVRYCFDQPPSGSGNTFDMGIFEPRQPRDASWGMAERRGWSGSAVRDLAIAVNGFTDEATYDASRKAYVSGFTTRAYQPGPISLGEWAVELGLASIGGAPGVAWRVRVETTDDPSWSDDPYSPTAYDTSAAAPDAGWYTGDLHAHGEQEPGNAPVRDSLDYAFGPLEQGGAGLDFITMVDHNNDVFEGEAGRYQPDYPGKLIIPGTEVTTYAGHYNEQGSSAFADYRGGPVYRFEPGPPPALTKTQDPVAPASQFAAIRAAGGWAQINHPTIFPSDTFGSLCRGCFWEYGPADTDFQFVDAIEIQTGPGELGGSANPFTETAIGFYESALASGAHIAAVGSSDSHQADQFSVTSAPIGRASTVVYAGQLSKTAIEQGVRDDHTYVKVFGSDGPDVRLSAKAPGKSKRIIGDSLRAPSARFKARVLDAGPGAARPGAYELRVLRDGTPVESAPISDDDFKHRFETAKPGRYSLEVVRAVAAGELVEVYSSPIWFERVKPSNEFKLGKLDRKRGGAARLRVEVQAGQALALGEGHTAGHQQAEASPHGEPVGEAEGCVEAQARRARTGRGEGRDRLPAHRRQPRETFKALTADPRALIHAG